MKWEYKTVATANHKTFDEDFKELGEEGWELVHIERTNGGIVNALIGFFKRPKE